jgi:chromosome segregation ATPase
MRDWEHDEKRIMREFTEDRQSNDESIERKRALIEQDRGEQRVVSGFTPAEREREIEADDRDRQQELKEIEQKRLKDEAELQQLSERLETLSSMSSAVIRSVQDQPKEIPKVDSKVLQVIRKIPISPEAVSRASIDWNRVINEQTLLKLRSWLRSKLERLGCSDDEAQVLSSFVVRSMDSGSHSLYAIAACMRRLKRLDEDTVSELSKKCVQLLLFSQFILQ